MNINVPNKKFVEGQIEALSRYLTYRFDEAHEKRNEKNERYTEGYELYEGILPRPTDTEKAVAPIVVPVVRSVVDKLQPSLMNIFTENESQAVVFRPQRTLLSKEVIDAVNMKINDIFLRQNNGYNVLANAFREVLVSGDAFLKIFIETDVIEEELDLGEEGMPLEMFGMILQEFPDTELGEDNLKELKQKDEITNQEIVIPFVVGKVVLTRIERKPRVKFVPFNEVYVLADSVDIADTRYLCHRIKKSVGELVDMGFDYEVVKEATVQCDSDAIDTSDIPNKKSFSSESSSNEAYIYDPMEKEVHLYEHFIWTSLLDKKGKSKLYQVFSVDVGKILEINEVARIPFIHGVSDVVPGAFWGTSMADRFGTNQMFMTSILRDYALNSKSVSHPRWQAQTGQYNRQSLLNASRPGAIIEVSAMGAVQPFQIPTNNNELIGVMQFVQGINNEEISNTIGMNVDPSNMANMTATAVAASVHNSEMKDKRIAKSLAYTMIRPLFEMLYNIIKEEGLPLEVEGMVPTETGEMVQAVVPFDSAQLPSRSEFYIDVNTATDDALQTQTLMGMATTLAQLSAMPSQVLTPANLYAIGTRILRSADINNVDDFLTDPAKLQPSPEELEMQQQQQAMEMQRAQDLAEAQLGQAAAQQNLIETQAEELVKMNNWKRELDEKQLLVEMEKLELKRQEQEAKAEQDAIRNEIRQEELAVEASTGQTIGIS